MIKHYANLQNYKDYLMTTYNALASFVQDEDSLLNFIRNEYYRVIYVETYGAKHVEIPTEISSFFYKWFYNTKLLEPIRGSLH